MTVNRPYRTEKLTFAAYLIASNKAELVGAEPIAGRRSVIFTLSCPPSREEMTHFFNGTATVSALSYAEAINTLKSAAYETRRHYDEL